MKKCHKESAKGSYTELYFLMNEKLGNVVCWRDKGRTCYSDCAAFEEKNNVVMCNALPGKTCIIAQLVEKSEVIK